MPIRFASKPGLVAYLTAGDPDLKTTRAIALAAIDAGADVIELGVPFSDPLADGPVIQRASERAVAHGTKLADVLALAKDLRAARPDAGLVIFSYFNPIVRFGLERFCSAAEDAGVDGVLVTDMIVEEAANILRTWSGTSLRRFFWLLLRARMRGWNGLPRFRRALCTRFRAWGLPARSSRWPPMPSRW